MYCKHCGKEIEENSSFCKHCGKPLDNNLKGLTNMPGWIIYLIWALENLYLLMGKKEEDCANYFYPFTSNKWDNGYYTSYQYSWLKEFYDFSEFVIYVFIIPAILYVIYRRYNKQVDKFIDRILNKK